MLNHVHLWDLVDDADDDDTAAMTELAGRVARAWEMAAAEQLPHRDLVVEVSDDYGPTLTLRSRRPDEPRG